MQEYKPLFDKETVGDVANNIIAQAYDPLVDAVKLTYGNDTIVVYVHDDSQTVTINLNDEMRIVPFDDSVKAVQTALETSADRQQDEAGL